MGDISKFCHVSCAPYRKNGPIRLIHVDDNRINKDPYYMGNHNGPSLQENLDWLMGGSFPGYKCVLDYLYDVGVRTIITLLLEPIKPGRNINHQSYNHKGTEWVESDVSVEDLSKFSVINIKVADGGYMKLAVINELLVIIRELAEKNKNILDPLEKHKVYIHCWAGRGRTTMAIILILTKIYGVDYKNALNWVSDHGGEPLLSPIQTNFLQNKQLYKEYIEYSQPIIRTPSDHECYKHTFTCSACECVQ